MARLTLNTLNARMDTLEARFDATDAKIDQLIALYKQAPASGQGNPQPTVEKVAYTKADGTVVMATPKQVAAWDAWKAGAGDRKENQTKFEEMKATWEESRKAFKPSKELIKAIQTNRAAVTHAEAKKLGFVGTKQDLQALKAQLCK